MLEELPTNAAPGVGEIVVIGLLALSLVSVLCIGLAVLLTAMSRQLRGRRATVLGWLAMLAGVAALGPPLFVFLVVER